MTDEFLDCVESVIDPARLTERHAEPKAEKPLAERGLAALEELQQATLIAALIVAQDLDVRCMGRGSKRRYEGEARAGEHHVPSVWPSRIRF